MNKTIVYIIVLLVIIGGGIILYISNSYNNYPNSSTNQTEITKDGSLNNNTNVTTNAVATSTTTTKTVKEFTIVGDSFSFTPNTITVKKGDTVKILFKDSNGIHNLTISGYNVSTQTISAGGETNLEFVANKTGSFEYYCSVDSHKSRGMVGTLIVQN